MIAWNNVQLLVEIKLAKKFGQNGAQNQVLCHFFQFGVLVFQEIVQDDSVKHCLTTSRDKTHGKSFGGPKLGPKLGFLLFSQGCIITFLSYCTRLQLGLTSSAETSTKKFVAQTGAEMIFSIPMSSSVHSNLLVQVATRSLIRSYLRELQLPKNWYVDEFLTLRKSKV